MMIISQFWEIMYGSELVNFMSDNLGYIEINALRDAVK